MEPDSLKSPIDWFTEVTTGEEIALPKPRWILRRVSDGFFWNGDEDEYQPELDKATLFLDFEKLKSRVSHGVKESLVEILNYDELTKPEGNTMDEDRKTEAKLKAIRALLGVETEKPDYALLYVKMKHGGSFPEGYSCAVLSLDDSCLLDTSFLEDGEEWDAPNTFYDDSTAEIHYDKDWNVVYEHEGHLIRALLEKRVNA